MKMYCTLECHIARAWSAIFVLLYDFTNYVQTPTGKILAILKDVRHQEIFLIKCNYDVIGHIVYQYKNTEFPNKTLLLHLFGCNMKFHYIVHVKLQRHAY